MPGILCWLAVCNAVQCVTACYGRARKQAYPAQLRLLLAGAAHAHFEAVVELGAGWAAAVHVADGARAYVAQASTPLIAAHPLHAA